MPSLTKLLRLLQTTRSQLQYGYALAEIPASQISNLAEHHYLATFITWQLCRAINASGGKLSVEKALEISLIHDLGELFGGDIAMPYAKLNPEAKKHAKAFEQENAAFLTALFPDDRDHIGELFSQAANPATDEARIAKIADYMEVSHYKLYLRRLSEKDISMIAGTLQQMAQSIEHPKTRTAAGTFIKRWCKEILAENGSEVFESGKTA